jgi:hypothetical protein
MSRKAILALAAAATVAVAGLASNSSYARGFVGGHAFGGGHGFGGGGRSFARVGRAGPVGRGPIGRLRVGGDPGGRIHPIVPGRPPGHHPPIIVGWHPHHHWHWVFRFGRWVDVDDVIADTVVDAAPAVVSTPAPVSVPGPCTCLTKTYTPTGLVVFADVCTKESASAPATDDTADASQAPTTSVPATATPMSQVPTTPNYAGRTFEDYLAANPQSAQPQASSQTPQQQQTPPAPAQN